MKKHSCLHNCLSALLQIAIFVFLLYIANLIKCDLIAPVGIFAYMRIKYTLALVLLWWLFPIVWFEYAINTIDKSHIPTNMHSRINRFTALIAIRVICLLPMSLYLSVNKVDIPQMNIDSVKWGIRHDLLLLASPNLPITATIIALVLGILCIFLTVFIFIRGLDRHSQLAVSVLLILQFPLQQVAFGYNIYIMLSLYVANFIIIEIICSLFKIKKQ